MEPEEEVKADGAGAGGRDVCEEGEGDTLVTAWSGLESLQEEGVTHVDWREVNAGGSWVVGDFSDALPERADDGLAHFDTNGPRRADVISAEFGQIMKGSSAHEASGGDEKAGRLSSPADRGAGRVAIPRLTPTHGHPPTRTLVLLSAWNTLRA